MPDSAVNERDTETACDREVFGDIPGPFKVAFYTVIPIVLAWGAFRFADRMRNWERGGPAQRRTTTENAEARPSDFRAGVYMQTLLRDPAAGIMHSLIYFGFLVLLGVTTVLEINHQLPEDLKFLHGYAYQAYSPSATPPASCSPSGCCGRSSAATSSGRTASASSRSPSTR